MKWNERLIRGVLLCESHVEFRKEKGVIADAVSRVADNGFFGAISIAEIDNREDRKRIRDIVETHGIFLTQWETMVIGDEGLNLCALDSRLRDRSVCRIRELIELAAETGVRNVGLLCGPDPGAALRAEATIVVCESLGTLCEATSRHPDMRLMIEPLDRDVHKKGLVGPTPEAVALLDRLKKSHSNVGLSLDTSHAVLLDEDPADTLDMLAPHLLEIHLSNPVLDRSSPYYGDYHIPPGPPGVLDVPDFTRVLKHGTRPGTLPGPVPVSAEVRSPRGGDPWETVELCASTLRRVLDDMESGTNQ